MNSKPHSGKTAVVYDRDITGLGGGDREALAFAKMLTSYGFSTQVVTNVLPIPSEERIATAFGDEFDGVAIKHVEISEMAEFFKVHQPDMFFNQSYMSYFPNPAPFGIYRQMFPVQRLWVENSPVEVEAINSYSMILNNSSYTKKYTDLHWDYPAEQSHVLHPPLAAPSIKKAEDFLEDFPKKKKLFVSIGRITQHKNQKVMIEAFLEARRRFPVLRDWDMLLIGNRVDDEKEGRYFTGCEDLVAGSEGSIQMEANAPYSRIEEALTEAFCYLHATGAFHLPSDQPQACEHFGLSIAEGMAHGCLPLIYARGGIFDILDVNEGGVPYITYEGLVEGFAEIAEQWDTDKTSDMQTHMMRSVLKVRYERCSEQLLGIINQAMS
jgi:glycosyltransferase involved in cell wall biosynthesis